MYHVICSGCDGAAAMRITRHQPSRSNGPPPQHHAVTRPRPSSNSRNSHSGHPRFPSSTHPGEKDRTTAAPSRALRTNEDEAEQSRPRSLPGSAGSFSLVDIRDGGNVVDWYPEDHPAMTDIIQLGRRSSTPGGAAAASAISPTVRAPRERAGSRSASDLRRPATEGVRNGLRQSARILESRTQYDDRSGPRNDGPGDVRPLNISRPSSGSRG